MRFSSQGGAPQWPPYYAPALASAKSGLNGWVTDQQITFSDQPWAIAWYADRVSVWLPVTRAGFEKIENLAEGLETPAAGIIISPVSHGSAPITEVIAEYQDFSPMVFDGKNYGLSGASYLEADKRISNIVKRYPHRVPLVGLEMIYYSDRPIVLSNPNSKN
jgi:hypothetical protein